jgi:hypothetical protein
LSRGASDIQQCVYSPETLKCGVDHNFGCFDLAQLERKGKRFGSGALDHSGNLFKCLRISRSQHNGGEIASQSDSGGTFDTLASSGHIATEFFMMPLHYCYVM